MAYVQTDARMLQKGYLAMCDLVERLRELEAVESELACEGDCPPEATANYRYAMTCAEAADRIAQLEAALQEIMDRHVPDQPSCLDIDEADYIRRQHTELRRIARAALEQEARDE